ncbi:nuclear protein SET [Opitutus terrae PB90-1]|uniref:Nuclear protein SET n=1 Tax=Opitutus terrae (strain DSM 11246 / JCM 15787 / PB90-1) TaxID=452637 RepID=B1ZQP8_OPITP|nr:nuclear protein SET [Opitutus terrae PB90-1]
MKRILPFAIRPVFTTRCGLKHTRPKSSSARPPQPTTSPHSPWIRVAGSVIHGRGVYARVAIPAGTRVIEYTGERITKAEARRREVQRLARASVGNDGCVTIFELNQRYDLDARDTDSPAKLINHSCAPNCRAENIRGHIWIVARCDIPAGEELTFDYGFPLSEWRLHPCRCGEPSCPGYIVNSGQRWRLRRLLRAEKRRASNSGRGSAVPQVEPAVPAGSQET